MRSAWLSSITPERDGLVLPGEPAGHAADLHLRPGGAELHAGDAVARLDWAAHGGPHLLWGDGAPGTWYVTYLAADRGGYAGVGIDEADGGGAAATEAVRAAVDTRRNRTMFAFQLRRPIPLRSAAVMLGPGRDERETLAALVAALAARPELRARLAEPRRVARLARDVGGSPLTYEAERTGFRRRTFEALRSMRALGYRHRLGGRPLAGDPLPSVDEVVDAVLADVGRNAYARGVRLDRRRVTGLVRRHYLDVEPWPFAALTGVASPPAPAAGAEPGVSPSPPVADRPAAGGRARPERPDDYGEGHRPSWWRSAGAWVPGAGRADP